MAGARHGSGNGNVLAGGTLARRRERLDHRERDW
jgi:hypothetical protein